MKQKMLVSAYACEPWKGSEIGVGWNWVLQLSHDYELWVLTRANNREPIERWMAENTGFEDIHFVWFDLPDKYLRRKHGLKGVHRYYLRWTRVSDSVIASTMKANGIDTFFHVTYGNALWPVSRVGMNSRFIWGPIGGLETIPSRFSRHYSLRSRLMECARRVAARLVPLTPSFRERCRKAALIISKTGITADRLPHSCHNKVVRMTDVAADTTIELPTRSVPSDDVTRLLCVGRLDAWRGFDLAIQALALALESGKPLHLTILGKGADKARLQHLVATLGVTDHVTFAGEVSSDQYRQALVDADVVLNPALKEGAVTVAYDALAAGKPLIALDTTGYTDTISSSGAIIITPSSRHDTIRALANAILKLTDLAERSRMADCAKAISRSLSWDQHGQEIRNLFKHNLS